MKAEEKTLCEEVKSSFELWGDPKLWLLCFMNVNTGFSDAYKVSNFNHLAATNIAPYAIGVLTLVQYFSGMLLVRVYEPMAHRFSKGLVILSGSVGYMLIPLLHW